MVIVDLLKKLIGELETETMTTYPEVDLVKLSQIKCSLDEKVDMLKRIDEQILALMEEEDKFIEDIEGADEYKALAYAAIIKMKMFSTEAPVKRALSVTPTTSEPPRMTAILLRLLPFLKFLWFQLCLVLQ